MTVVKAKSALQLTKGLARGLVTWPALHPVGDSSSGVCVAASC